MSNYEELRYLTDVANDPALENAKRKFKKGIKKLKKKLQIYISLISIYYFLIDFFYRFRIHNS